MGLVVFHEKMFAVQMAVDIKAHKEV